MREGRRCDALFPRIRQYSISYRRLEIWLPANINAPAGAWPAQFVNPVRALYNVQIEASRMRPLDQRMNSGGLREPWSAGIASRFPEGNAMTDTPPRCHRHAPPGLLLIFKIAGLAGARRTE